MNDRVAHAKAYPFPAPGRSYIFRNGEVHPLDDHAFERTGRVPVLACGSNQSHEQLRRKYAVLPGHVEIPVQRGSLSGFDAVYAAHFSRYGSVPATFHPSPGTRVTTYVLWLDEAQLARMHETEGNYTYDRLEAVRVEIDGTGEVIEEAFVYTAKVGSLNVGGAPVALAEIAAEGRIHRAMRQAEMLAHVCARLAPGTDVDAFIHAHIEDETIRRDRTAALSADALKADFPRIVLEEF